MLAITIIFGIFVALEGFAAWNNYQTRTLYIKNIEALTDANTRLARELDRWREQCIELDKALIMMRRDASDNKETVSEK